MPDRHIEHRYTGLAKNELFSSSSHFPLFLEILKFPATKQMSPFISLQHLSEFGASARATKCCEKQLLQRFILFSSHLFRV